MSTHRTGATPQHADGAADHSPDAGKMIGTASGATPQARLRAAPDGAHDAPDGAEDELIFDTATQKRLKRIGANNTRRARLMGCEAVSFDLAAHFQAMLTRDGALICDQCGLGIDWRAAPPDGSSLSCGHRTALGVGGAHSPRNVFPEHLACNLAHGREVATPAAAKAKRQARLTGNQRLSKPASRWGKAAPMAGTKASGWKTPLRGKSHRRDG